MNTKNTLGRNIRMHSEHKEKIIANLQNTMKTKVIDRVVDIADIRIYLNRSVFTMSILRTLIVSVVVALLVVSTAHAASTTYSIHDFTLTQGNIAPTAGGFTYDPAIGFSDFWVQWYEGILDMTYGANHPTLYESGLGYSVGTFEDSFSLMTKALPEPRHGYQWDAYTLSTPSLTVFQFGSRAPTPSGESFVFIHNAPISSIGPDTGVQVGTFTVSSVPVPSTLTLLGGGLFLIGLWQRFRRDHTT